MPENSETLLDVQGLTKLFPVRGKTVLPTYRYVQAVKDVSFQVRRGEVLAIVGESGSGKTTLGRMLIRLLEPTAGSIDFDGTSLLALNKTQLRLARSRVQFIFQDPYSSLNPYISVGEAIGEVLEVHKITHTPHERDARVAELLEMVGLRGSAATRYPHEFSGGQRQRVGIARAIAANPDFIVADEPVSALDVSVQAQILNLMSDLRARMGLTMVFISHDLAVVRHIADRVAVMYLGHLMEIATAEDLFRKPMHPYTEALLSAVPAIDRNKVKERQVLHGDIPSPLSPPSGCVFRTRCPYAIEACAKTVPVLETCGSTRSRACIRQDIMNLSEREPA
ncbi:ABC transporter ATP-binding protein [Salipiger marinus]|uniref:ABC transporter ATP-binding protein n=1 Tax=Salipiger marinus TaxID=555512 RepID=UPI002C356573|nr:ABC transporter ATP-binding protein [Salipiger manganoxidans]MEB3419305.1 ABC transporter ATP-binding protein [Salipiger manganoxidans]